MHVKHSVHLLETIDTIVTVVVFALSATNIYMPTFRVNFERLVHAAGDVGCHTLVQACIVSDTFLPRDRHCRLPGRHFLFHFHTLMGLNR